MVREAAAVFWAGLFHAQTRCKVASRGVLARPEVSLRSVLWVDEATPFLSEWGYLCTLRLMMTHGRSLRIVVVLMPGLVRAWVAKKLTVSSRIATSSDLMGDLFWKGISIVTAHNYRRKSGTSCPD